MAAFTPKANSQHSLNNAEIGNSNLHNVAMIHSDMDGVTFDSISVINRLPNFKNVRNDSGNSEDGFYTIMNVNNNSGQSVHRIYKMRGIDFVKHAKCRNIIRKVFSKALDTIPNSERFSTDNFSFMVNFYNSPFGDDHSFNEKTVNWNANISYTTDRMPNYARWGEFQFNPVDTSLKFYNWNLSLDIDERQSKLTDIRFDTMTLLKYYEIGCPVDTIKETERNTIIVRY